VFGPRQYRVMRLLEDGKVHATNELPLPEKTRDWSTAQWEDRHIWFWRLVKKGWVKRVGHGYGHVTLWKITSEGRERLRQENM